ncbi:hypothetical protein [Enterococcus casseliflavus]|uniref:hypothetical protein n=1 Tax=Enterococcus casseliflavus TaxID=37734 RepID=UPI003D6B0F92
MNDIDVKIIDIVKRAGGVNVPYGLVYKELGFEDGNDRKFARTVIRKYCKEKKGYREGYPDLFLITKDPNNLTHRLITLK